MTTVCLYGMFVLYVCMVVAYSVCLPELSVQAMVNLPMCTVLFLHDTIIGCCNFTQRRYSYYTVHCIDTPRKDFLKMGIVSTSTGYHTIIGVPTSDYDVD